MVTASFSKGFLVIYYLWEYQNADVRREEILLLWTHKYVFLDFCLTKTCKFDMRVLKTQRHIRDRKYGDDMEKKLQELETDSLM